MFGLWSGSSGFPVLGGGKTETGPWNRPKALGIDAFTGLGAQAVGAEPQAFQGGFDLGELIALGGHFGVEQFVLAGLAGDIGKVVVVAAHGSQSLMEMLGDLAGEAGAQAGQRAQVPSPAMRLERIG